VLVDSIAPAAEVVRQMASDAADLMSGGTAARARTPA
jgi:hypothetical protein